MKSPIKSTLAAYTLFLLGACTSTPETVDEAAAMRSEVRTMASETLAQLEAAQPGARSIVESAYG